MQAADANEGGCSSGPEAALEWLDLRGRRLTYAQTASSRQAIDRTRAAFSLGPRGAGSQLREPAASWQALPPLTPASSMGGRTGAATTVVAVHEANGSQQVSSLPQGQLADPTAIMSPAVVATRTAAVGPSVVVAELAATGTASKVGAAACGSAATATMADVSTLAALEGAFGATRKRGGGGLHLATGAAPSDVGAAWSPSIPSAQASTAPAIVGSSYRAPMAHPAAAAAGSSCSSWAGGGTPLVGSCLPSLGWAASAAAAAAEVLPPSIGDSSATRADVGGVGERSSTLHGLVEEEMHAGHLVPAGAHSHKRPRKEAAGIRLVSADTRPLHARRARSMRAGPLNVRDAFTPVETAEEVDLFFDLVAQPAVYSNKGVLSYKKLHHVWNRVTRRINAAGFGFDIGYKSQNVLKAFHADVMKSAAVKEAVMVQHAALQGPAGVLARSLPMDVDGGDGQGLSASAPDQTLHAGGAAPTPALPDETLLAAAAAAAQAAAATVLHGRVGPGAAPDLMQFFSSMTPTALGMSLAPASAGPGSAADHHHLTLGRTQTATTTVIADRGVGLGHGGVLPPGDDVAGGNPAETERAPHTTLRQGAGTERASVGEVNWWQQASKPQAGPSTTGVVQNAPRGSGKGGAGGISRCKPCTAKLIQEQGNKSLCVQDNGSHRRSCPWCRKCYSQNQLFVNKDDCSIHK